MYKSLQITLKQSSLNPTFTGQKSFKAYATLLCALEVRALLGLAHAAIIYAWALLQHVKGSTESGASMLKAQTI